MASFSDIQLDAGIARGLKRGDEKAQTVAYRVLSPAVMGMAVRMLQDHGLAQEVVQDTFVELIEHAHALKDPAAVIGWVRKVAVNHCLMRLRSPWHQRRTSSDEEGAEEVSDVQTTAARSDDLWDLETALASLPADTRMVLWLHDVEGYTHQEIAALAGKTVSYSKSQLARGYEKLAQKYREAEAASDHKPPDQGNTQGAAQTGREHAAEALPPVEKRVIDHDNGQNFRPVSSS